LNPHYNQNYTLKQIEEILKIIQDCIRNDKYIISLNKNRIENIEFVRKYRLEIEARKNILLSINPTDFCHALQDRRIGFEHKTLYVFCPCRKLTNTFREKEWVDIYIKFTIDDCDIYKQVITISFHKRNKPIQYLFKLK
jgi:hypothetical protein